MKKYLTIVAAAIFIASCSSDTEINKATNRVPIELGTSMQVTSTRSNDQTLQATELVAGQTAGVYVYYKGNKATTSSYGYLNKSYAATGTSGDLALASGETTPYYPDDKSKAVDIYVYSPRVSTLSGELSAQTAVMFNTAADQTSAANYQNSDFVWGVKENVTTTTSAVEVPLTHKLSKINVNIAAGTGVTLSSLVGASITLADVNLAGTANLTTGAVSTTGSTTSTLTFTTATAAPTGKLASSATTDCYTASAIIIPQTITSKDLTITLSNGSKYKYSLSKAFAASTSYTFDITVDAKGLSLTTTIADWTADTGGPITGKAE